VGLVSEKVVISYQGARFRLGRSQTFFAIWPDGTPLEHPLEQWPATPDGWSAAWVRFNELETPGTIVQAQPSASAWGGRAAAPALTGFKVTNSSALLVIGVVFGAVGLFPSYWTGTTLISTAGELVPHLLYLIAWAIAAIGVLAGGNRARAGALLGLGTSAATLGLFVTDLGQTGSGTSVGPGLVLSCIGWVACTAGVVLALRGTWNRRETLALRPSAGVLAATVLLGAVAIGAAVTYALSWNTLTFATAEGQLQTVAYGNISQQTGLEIFGSVLVMAAVILVAMLSGLWRHVRIGSALLAGLSIPLVAQAISAVIETHDQTTTYASSLKSGGDTFISYGLTPSFWLFCLFGVALVISAAWMLFSAPALGADAGVPASPAPASSENASDEDSSDSDSDNEVGSFHDPDSADTDILTSGDDAPAL
jgi:hypothetical protein